MADRTLAVKYSGTPTGEPANAARDDGTGLFVPNPTYLDLTPVPATPLAVLGVPNGRAGSGGYFPVVAGGSTNQVNASPPTTVVQFCLAIPFMVEQQKTLAAIHMKLTAINGVTSGSSAVLSYGLHSLDHGSLQTTLIKNLGFYTHTSISTLAAAPNASGTALSPGITYVLTFNPATNGSASQQVTTYAVPGGTVSSPIPVMTTNDPPLVADWTSRSIASVPYYAATQDPAALNLDLTTPVGYATCPLIYLQFN